MKQIIRQADSSDMEVIYLMGYDVWSEGSSKEDYLLGCQSSTKYKRGTWFVLEEGGMLLCSLILYQFNGNSFGIGSIATVSEVRHRGHASNLITSVLKILEKDFISLEKRPQQSKIFLYSDINPEFYEKFGFKPVSSAAQRYKTTICMVKSESADEIVHVDQTPEYF